MPQGEALWAARSSAGCEAADEALPRLWPWEAAGVGMLMSHRHPRWGPGCGILSPLSLWSPSPGASSVAGEGHGEVLGPLHAWLGARGQGG